MPKTKISEFSATPGNNTDIDGINIAEGCAPSGINDAIRELMAQLKDFQAGTAGDSFNGPVGTTTAAAGAFTNLSASGTFALTGDQVQISEGGTGQTTANAAFNALAPSQATHAGKYLKTDGTNTSWDALDISTADITGTLPVANGGTGVTSSTGTGSVVLSASPTFTGTVNGASLTLSSNFTLSGGTANGVAYLNGSKVLTTGSALVFDGTNLGIGASPTYKLDLSGTNPAFRLKAGAGFGYIIDQNTSSSLVSHILYENADMRWGVNSAEAMRLTSTGLGIGTSSPGYKLSVATTTDHVGLYDTDVTGLVHVLSGNGNSSLYIGADNGNVAASSNLIFGVDGTERARIDSSGNLGLGVTPPSGTVGFSIKGSAGDAQVRLYNSTSGATSTDGILLSIDASLNGYLWNYENAPLLFGTNNTERARITSGGYFKASNNGTYTSSGSFHEFVQTNDAPGLSIFCSNASLTTYGVAYIEAARNTTNNTFYAISYYNTGAAAYKFRVADSGDVTNTNGTYGTISDAKMKTDIVDAGSQWSDIKALRFRKFKMKDDPSGLVQLGVVAQEVELTSPGLVDEHVDRDGEGTDLGTTTKSVKTSVLLMKAAVALQEAMARIEQLEAKVAALETK